MKNSFVELRARERGYALLDQGTGRELVGPFDEMISPHLEPQNIVPESDDGIVLLKGKLAGNSVLVISIEGTFQGGGIGEVGGAKIVAALENVLKDNQSGTRIYPILILDTGGVRLQEANYGLLSISEIGNVIVALKKYVPVIGIIPGLVGSFGGMSITAALMSHLIATKKARIGLNGPEVIEQEAGVMEFDASDKEMIWSTIGARQRLATDLIDELVADNCEAIKKAVFNGINEEKDSKRTDKAATYLNLLSQLNFTQTMTPESYQKQIEEHRRSKAVVIPEAQEGDSNKKTSLGSRGGSWFAALTGLKWPINQEYPTLLYKNSIIENQKVAYISVVPNVSNSMPRVRNGEVGLVEGFGLATIVHQIITEDQTQVEKRPIVAIIDVPSQAYGYKEELIGIHLALASSAAAYAKARQMGHPVIGVIVGNAISGAFLAHGLQANRLIALNDAKINVQAMSKASAARITHRSVEELELATSKVPAMAYDIQNFAKLGALYRLVDGINGDKPTIEEQQMMQGIILQAIESTKNAPTDLSYRYQTEAAKTTGRVATIKVRQLVDKQWE
ncbi:biotin-independent malonate decarboxylase subunit beta [Carnobacterium gallinarum]|uniref:biotin-independent malonate decarboxylase subunit beta n=1 Tax=Carnobacterium gallinarum TaxID=2749 RepID=UPI000558E775|nr:biotin-independent malonate decarboxylase subunit beta [Carnobacterium gallinarum]